MANPVLCCCCTGTCECMPSTIDFNVGDWGPHTVNSSTVEWSAQTVTGYLCCYNAYNQSTTRWQPQIRYFYLSDPIACGTHFSTGATLYTFIYACNSILQGPKKCAWVIGAWVGYSTKNNGAGTDCATLDDVSVCKTALELDTLIMTSCTSVSQTRATIFWNYTNPTPQGGCSSAASMLNNGVLFCNDYQSGALNIPSERCEIYPDDISLASTSFPSYPIALTIT